MKKLLYILLLLPVLVFGQTIENNRIVFREEFRDEFSVRFNGGESTDVTFSEGKGAFNGTSSFIRYSTKTFSAAQSATFRMKVAFGEIEPVYLLSGDANNSIITGFAFTTATGFIIKSGAFNITLDFLSPLTVDTFYEIVLVKDISSTWKLYLNGILQDTGLHPDELIYWSSFGERYNGAIDGEHTWDLFEIYNCALSADQIFNLYRNRRFVSPSENELLRISATSGTILNRWSTSITNTDVTVVKLPNNVIQFNGSSSVIETTLANTIKTVSFWIYTDNLTQSVADFGSGNTVTISGGTITAAWADNIYIDGETGAAISVNQWYLVTLTDAGIAVTDIDIGKEGANFYKGFMNDVIISEDLFPSTTVSQEFTSHKYYYVK